LWTELQQATAGEKTPAVDLWAIMQERLDPSLKKPKGEAGIEVSSHHTAQGAAYYVLNNPEADTYLKVDAHDYFLWGLMDGEASTLSATWLWPISPSSGPFPLSAWFISLRNSTRTSF
jgi:hypothetical protein